MVSARRCQALYWAAALGMLLAVFVLLAAWALYLHLGHTPGRLLDYVEQRMERHPKVQAIGLPMTGLVRDVLDEPNLRQRLAEPFLIPPPPSPWPARADNQSADPVPGRRILRVGPREAIRTIAEAARQAKDGDVVEIAAGDYHGDVAVWLQRRLTIRGVGGQARLYAQGRSAEGKAIWVIRNGHFDIANIDFIGARVADRNGAGIRFENGHLIVRSCLFWGSEAGLLTSGGPSSGGARLEIEYSEFGYNGDGVGQSHHVYAGNIALLRVVGSYFHHGNVGHLIKSRAAVNDIRYNRLTDEAGGRASYEIDLSNGGLAVVLGNVIQQGRRTENSALISYGREGYRWPLNRLHLASNTMVNDHPYGGAFLRAAAGADGITAMNNLLVGPGRYHGGAELQVANDVAGDWSLFAHPARHDYRLDSNGRRLHYQRPVLDEIQGIRLEPDAEYDHPRTTRSSSGLPRHPGAHPF